MDRQIKVVIVILVANFLLVPFISNHYAYYIPKTHAFTIQEQGIPNGTRWGVELFDYHFGVKNELNNYYSYNSEISLELPYGYYHYSPITPSGYESNSGGVDFHLAGSIVPSGSMVKFLKLYYLTFRETGLPSNSSWSVTVHTAKGIASHSSSSNSMSFYLPFGSYAYKAAQASGPVRKSVEFPTAVDESGFATTTLNASSNSVSVAFTNETYPVTVNITAGFHINNQNIYGVGVQMNGQTQYSHYNFGSGKYSTVKFNLPDGIYQCATPNITGYSIAGNWAYVHVHNAPTNTTLAFSLVTHNSA